jgi:acyl dehydratase
MPLYLEDLTPGMTLAAGPITLTSAETIDFAQRFDPQPFHTDPIAAQTSFFNGLAASGWHVAALCMRLITRTPLAEIANGLIGIEIRHLRWPRPTRPGDTLQLGIEVLETTASRSKPGWGTAVLRATLRNQRGETAMELENVIWVACRPTGS